MTASDYDFNSTRNEIVERAYRIIGKNSLGDPLSGEMMTQAVIALNSMVKSWQSKHVFLWTIRDFTQSLSNGVASYSLASSDPAVYALDSAYLRINNVDTRLDIASWRQYWDIPNKIAPGDPSIVALNTDITPTLYVWPVPTQTRTLRFSGLVKLKDFDAAGGNPDFPVRYLDALTFGLAHALSFEYGLPLAERKEIERQYQANFQEAKSGERERAELEFCDGAFK